MVAHIRTAHTPANESRWTAADTVTHVRVPMNQVPMTYSERPSLPVLGASAPPSLCAHGAFPTHLALALAMGNSSGD